MLKSVVLEIEDEEMSQVDITDFPWAEFNVVENRPQYVADTLGLQRKRRSKNIHRYEFEMVTREMDPDTEGRRVKAQLAKACRGEIIYRHPRYSFTRGLEPAGGILTNTTLNAGITTIGLTSTNVWQLMAGDYVQFVGDTKVYEIEEDTQRASGTQVVKLVDPLRITVAPNTMVTVNNVQWHLISDGMIEFETEASNNQDIQIVLNVVEDL